MKRAALYSLPILAAIVPVGVALAEQAAGAPLTPGDAIASAVSGATLWVELLRASPGLTVAVAATMFALRKDKEVRDNAVSHAAELKEMNEEVIALVGAATQAQTELRGAVAALKDGLLAIERMIDRRSGP